MATQDIESVDFYWRKGCGFCMMLERNLSRAGVELDKHNIWDDPAHAAVVRSHARGNETVPTVVIGDTALVNPSAKQVLAVLAEKAPQLLPELASASDDTIRRSAPHVVRWPRRSR